MKNNSLKMLAKELMLNGIATLRYDKRGIGESKNARTNESDLRFENYIEDAEGWISLLEQDNRFGDIIIIGHSEGSLIGMVASQHNNVSKYISIAGCGQTADKIIKEQLKSQPPLVLEKALPILAKLVDGETVENVPQMLNSLFRPSIQPYMISWIKYNPKEEIAKLEKPVLIIQGTTDIQVSTEDAERLANANPKAKKQMIDGMNHIMKEAALDRQKNIQTYNQPELPLKSELINIIVDFIK
jgi:alpha-beta hydrolase superfamily lysophospholipase